MMEIYIQCLNHDVSSTIKASKVIMLHYVPFLMNPFSNTSTAKLLPPYIFNNSLYIGSISTLSHDFEKKIMFPIYFIQQLQWIILKLLHYDTSQSCSILVTRMKKKPKTKAFKDTIQKVTNVSLRQNVFFSISVD